MQHFVKDIGEPKFRAQQLMDWIYKKNAVDFEEMTNLSKTLREKLNKCATINDLQNKNCSVSKIDGTMKFLFALEDHHTIESVIMFHPDRVSAKRVTACISTQVGCAMGCSFCATGKSGLVRNLTSSEIVNQVATLNHVLAASNEGPINNVVIMGMGEPLANYESTLKAIHIFNMKEGFQVGARHITLSTCGLVPQILRLAKEELQIVLAISLHAPNDTLRNQLIPINRKYPLAQLIDACQQYIHDTGRRITFEYSLMSGVNDTSHDAKELAALLKGLLCHVNLIPINPVEDTNYKRATEVHIAKFKEILEEKGIPVSRREEKGADIEAACGQLRRRQMT